MRRTAGIAPALALLMGSAAAAAPATPAAPLYDRPPISYTDYPADALRARQQGLVEVRLDVDSAGQVTGCTVLQSSGTVSLDAATCQLLQSRATFRPARDETGRPVPDQVVQKISWRILEKTTRDPALDAGIQRWVDCIGAEARRLAPERDSTDAIMDRAFAACTQTEQAFAAALTAAGPEGAPPVKEVPAEIRGAVRKSIQKNIEPLRPRAI